MYLDMTTFLPCFKPLSGNSEQKGAAFHQDLVTLKACIKTVFIYIMCKKPINPKIWLKVQLYIKTPVIKVSLEAWVLLGNKILRKLLKDPFEISNWWLKASKNKSKCDSDVEGPNSAVFHLPHLNFYFQSSWQQNRWWKVNNSYSKKTMYAIGDPFGK